MRSVGGLRPNGTHRSICGEHTKVYSKGVGIPHTKSDWDPGGERGVHLLGNGGGEHREIDVCKAHCVIGRARRPIVCGNSEGPLGGVHCVHFSGENTYRGQLHCKYLRAFALRVRSQLLSVPWEPSRIYALLCYAMLCHAIQCDTILYGWFMTTYMNFL